MQQFSCFLYDVSQTSHIYEWLPGLLPGYTSTGRSDILLWYTTTLGIKLDMCWIYEYMYWHLHIHVVHV